jgi:hypothetical protein
MQLPDERSSMHVAPRPPLPCDAYVDSGAAPEGWYAAELLEWIHFPTSGWMARVRYRTSASGGYVGYFSSAHVRGANPPG